MRTLVAGVPLLLAMIPLGGMTAGASPQTACVATWDFTFDPPLRFDQDVGALSTMTVSPNLAGETCANLLVPGCIDPPPALVGQCMDVSETGFSATTIYRGNCFHGSAQFGSWLLQLSGGTALFGWDFHPERTGSFVGTVHSLQNCEQGISVAFAWIVLAQTPL